MISEIAFRSSLPIDPSGGVGRHLRLGYVIAIGSVTITGQSMAEISRFVAEQIASIDGVRETMTQIVMRTYKEQGVEMARPGSRDRQLITF